MPHVPQEKVQLQKKTLHEKKEKKNRSIQTDVTTHLEIDTQRNQGHSIMFNYIENCLTKGCKVFRKKAGNKKEYRTKTNYEKKLELLTTEERTATLKAKKVPSTPPVTLALKLNLLLCRT